MLITSILLNKDTFAQRRAQMLFSIRSLNRCNGSNLKQAVALCKCIFLLHPLSPSILTGARLQGHIFITITYCHQFLFFFPLQLYVTFLLSAAHNACNRSVFDVHVFLSSCATKNEKKVRGFVIKLSYLPTIARLCSEPHAI